MRQWRLIVASPTAGAYNMGIDDALFTLSEAPTLRLYAWNPPCLSLGYGQKASDVDVDRAAALGWDVVRRPTGGRAILHADELTYSLSLPPNHPIGAGSVIESYQRISRALVMGLTQLGVNTQADQQTQRTHAGAVCFETPSHYEITVHGRKLVGSAQVRRQGRVLQHGSLPLHGDITQICAGLHYADANQREFAREQVRRRAITLSAALGHSVNWHQVAGALITSFSEAFAIELHAGDLTPAERDHAEQATAAMYANPDWTFRR